MECQYFSWEMLQRKEPRFHWFLFAHFSMLRFCREGVRLPAVIWAALQYYQMFSPGLSQLLTLAKSSWDAFRNVLFHVIPRPQEIGAGNPSLSWYFPGLNCAWSVVAKHRGRKRWQLGNKMKRSLATRSHSDQPASPFA